MMLTHEGDLGRQRRLRLFGQLAAANTPRHLLEVQIAVLEAVRELESRKASAATKVERLEIGDEIRMYRSYGDAIAWLLLHPHTIRQLADRPGKPPALSSIGETIEKSLAVARATASTGVPSIVCDLTNILRVGDLICVRNPEVPDLIEIKGDRVIMPLALLGQDSVPVGFQEVTQANVIPGRTGRQISLMLSIAEYLKSGQAKVYGNPATKVAIEISSSPEYYWPQVESVAAVALERGSASIRLDDRHWLLAVTRDHDLEKDELLGQELRQAKQVMIASHYRPLEEAWTSISTPFNWHLSDPVRFALMEGDVQIATVFDVSTLVGRGYAGASIQEVLVDDPHLGPDSIRVELDGQSYTVSNRALLEVLFGFRTTESMVNEVCELVVESMAFHARREATDNGDSELSRRE